MRSAVVDIDPERISDLALEGRVTFVPGYCADAGESEALIHAGLLRPRCAGVVALTNDDNVNLKIAITCKLLRPRLPVICRAESHETEKNMASFGTDHIINPFDSFADHLAMALHSPSTHLIHEWLTGIPGTVLAGFLEPRRGVWVLCGYGRFGKAVERYMSYEGVNTVIVEADPEGTETPEGAIIGRGTEADTLRAARIDEAVGIVAGTDNDTNNLSIVVTARDINPSLFTVARQNRRSNEDLFRAADVDVVMERSDIIAHKILALITAPLLSGFLRSVRRQKKEWVNELVSRMVAVVGEVVPDIWGVEIADSDAPAPARVLREGGTVTLGELTRDPRNHEEGLSCMALFLRRGEEELLLPEDSMELAAGDRILFCGREHVHGRMAGTLLNLNTLRYIQTGIDRPDGLVWRWLARSG
jgi:Trk K+ transport system NAD-binding subunit